MPCMVNDDFEPRFSLKNMFKDVQIAIAAGASKNLEFPTASAFAGIAMSGLQRGWGDSDFSVISRFFGYPGKFAPMPPPLLSATTPPAPIASSPQKSIWSFFRRAQ